MTALFQSVIVAVIIGLMGVGGQYLLKRQDWRRTDEVAHRVEETAVAQARTVELQKQAAADAKAAQDEAAIKAAEVAAQAVEAARLLAEAQKAAADKAAEAAVLLLASNERVAADTTTVQAQLRQIHTLVNSNMTAAMQSELDAIVRELAMMREVVALKQAAGREPTPETLGAIEATRLKIAELGALLADRLKQTEVADAEARADALDRPDPS